MNKHYAFELFDDPEEADARGTGLAVYLAADVDARIAEATNRAAEMEQRYDSATATLGSRIAELEKALRSIKEMTDADNPESYRSDDREGCLDTVFSVASRVL